ncbi:MAG: WbqC family protein [Bacteroidetes bacterium]|uniref:WbqC family protein n=1 Tax=Phnomibacter sp. TaxID=2836217 RepID=UPI002FDCBFA8|nr:WbqC family protein [Bacteroidota bacterium]
MMRKIEIQLFGPIAAFARLHEVETIVLEKQEHWQKMGYRNRFQVLGANDVLAITVPLQGGRDQKAMTADLTIDYHGRWMKEHWRTLESLYNRSPFFYHYAPGLQQIWECRHELLWDMAEQSLRWTLKQLRWQGAIEHSTTFSPICADDSTDFRHRFLPKNRTHFLLPAYQQTFGERFETNLSILDLLFNMGPSAAAYLKQLPEQLNQHQTHES